MANGQGIAVIDFGAFPGSNYASVYVPLQTTISATSKVEAFVMADNTSGDHDAEDHRYFAAIVGLTCGTPTAGDGFTIYGVCLEELEGPFLVNWVWTD